MFGFLLTSEPVNNKVLCSASGVLEKKYLPDPWSSSVIESPTIKSNKINQNELIVGHRQYPALPATMYKVLLLYLCFPVRPS